MTRSVSNDEFTFVGGEVAVGDIDGDTLFAFGFQTVEQEGIIDITSGVSYPFAVAFECIELIFIQLFAVEKKTTYQGRLSRRRPIRPSIAATGLFFRPGREIP